MPDGFVKDLMIICLPNDSGLKTLDKALNVWPKQFVGFYSQ
jgi:hypothetical protein